MNEYKHKKEVKNAQLGHWAVWVVTAPEGDYFFVKRGNVKHPRITRVSSEFWTRRQALMARDEIVIKTLRCDLLAYDTYCVAIKYQLDAHVEFHFAYQRLENDGTITVIPEHFVLDYRRVGKVIEKHIYEDFDVLLEAMKIIAPLRRWHEAIYEESEK